MTSSLANRHFKKKKKEIRNGLSGAFTIILTGAIMLRSGFGLIFVNFLALHTLFQFLW